MRNIKNRIDKLEDGFGINKDQFLVIVKSFTNFIELGYFKDEIEQESFISWRTDKIKEKYKYRFSPVIVYVVEEKDIKENIKEFREFNTKNDQKKI